MARKVSHSDTLQPLLEQLGCCNWNRHPAYLPSLHLRCGDAVVDYESFHPEIVEVIKKYFPHLEVAIVRYFHEADDVDF